MLSLRLLLLTGWVLLIVAGCSRKTMTSTSEVRDSTVIKYVPRLVEVKVPGDTVTIKELIECDELTNKPKPFLRKSKTAKAKVSVAIDKRGMLTATGGCDSLKTVVQTMDKEIFRLRHESKTQTETKIEYKTRTIDKWARTICLIEVIALAGYIFYKLNRIKFV